MGDGYWGLFWQTGVPEFYLLREREKEDGREKPERD